jgi:hypothetical protein
MKYIVMQWSSDKVVQLPVAVFHGPFGTRDKAIQFAVAEKFMSFDVHELREPVDQ